MAKGGKRNVEAVLKSIWATYPSVQGCEREFVSPCFVLATVTGKTRLMGALIAYLHDFYGVNNWCLSKPN